MIGNLIGAVGGRVVKAVVRVLEGVGVAGERRKIQMAA
jgi:hypothetical protein